ncbi:MAG: phosphatase PAP2 family protein [Clostridium sp.]|nr:phosphatase PAP2 family protein [Clostridium sp.]
MKNLIKKYGHAWIFSYFLLYLPWFVHLEKTVTRHYNIMHSELDDMIPFNEYFIIPYLLWFIYVAAAVLYFFFANKEEFYRLCTFLFTGMTLFLLICTIYPNGTDLRSAVDPQKNLCSWLVAWIRQTDTCTNVFPSIHVYNSICAHTAIRKNETLRKNPWIRYGSLLLAVSICLSTVFLKQHSVIDVAGAALMAIAIYPLAYAGNAERERRTAY